MKNFYSPSFVILLFTVQLFFYSLVTGYSFCERQVSCNNFFIDDEMKGRSAADLWMIAGNKMFFTDPQIKEEKKEQPIAYKFKISYKNFNKQKRFTAENFRAKDFEFSKFSWKKIGKNNNLSVSRKSVS